MRILSLLVLCTALVACGDKPADGPSSSGGAATPEALFEAMQTAGKNKDIGAIVNSVLPEERNVMAYFIGAMPVEIMIGMGKAFAQMGGEDAVAKIEKMEKDWKAFLGDKKMPDVDKIMEGSMEDPIQAMKGLADKLPDLDGTFVKEAHAFLEKHKDQDDANGGGGMDMNDEFSRELDRIDTQGDRAEVYVKVPADAKPGDEKPVIFVKKDGRWYLSFFETMTSKQSAAAAGAPGAGG